MAITEDYVITEFFSERKNAIIQFIIKHPECTIKEVENYCENRIATKKTVDKIIKELEKEGRLTNRPSSNDKRSRSLTIDSDNLLISLPRDFEVLLTRFQSFVMAIREWCIMPDTTFEKNFGTPERKIDRRLIARIITFLPYQLMDIVDQIYHAYFTVILPYKIDKIEHIRKLNSLYYNYVSQIRLYILENLHEHTPKVNFNSHNTSIHYHFLINMRQRPNIEKLIRLIHDCHAYSLQQELFDILNFLWERNIEIAYDQFIRYSRYQREIRNDKIDKYCLETQDPRLKTIYKGICISMETEDNLNNRPHSNYYYEVEKTWIDKIFNQE